MEHSKAFLELVEAAKRRITEVDAEAVRRKLDSGARFHLVDVREDSEWEQLRIPGSIHIGRGVLERDVEQKIPDRDAEIVLFCGGGYRSALAAENLERMGYRNVRSLAGGIRGWIANGFPTVAGDLGSGDED